MEQGKNPVLLAEDNEINRILVQRALEKHGYEVLTAVNGTDALKILEKTKVSVVLMDVEMPGTDGLEATRELRTNPLYRQNAQVPVVAMSAHDAGSDLEQARAAGMDHFFPKPISIPGLLELVQKFS